MPEFNSWQERYTWTSEVAKNAKNIVPPEDLEWLADQNLRLQNDSAIRAAKQGNEDAGDYLMQQYGWLGRYFGIGVPKTDKCNF